MRRRYALDTIRPTVDTMNVAWEETHTRQSFELIHQETHDLECSLAIGTGRRNSRDGRYVYPEPIPDINAPLPADMRRLLYVPIRLELHASESISFVLIKELLRTVATTTAVEMIADGQKIRVQMAIAQGTEMSTLGMLRTGLPQSRLHYNAPDLIDITRIHPAELSIAEYQLHTYTVYPLNTQFAIPPLQQFYALKDSPWGRDAIFGLQVLFTPCRADWHAFYQNLCRWVALPATGVISPHLPQPNEIMAKPTPEGMFATTIRLISDDARVLEVLHQNFVGSFNSTNQRLVFNHRRVAIDELVARTTRREGILLNADELAVIASFPSALVRSSALDRARIPSTRIPPDFTEE